MDDSQRGNSRGGRIQARGARNSTGRHAWRLISRSLPLPPNPRTTKKRTVGVPRVIWTLTAEVGGGDALVIGSAMGGKRFMVAWPEEDGETNRQRVTKPDHKGAKPKTETAAGPGEGGDQ